MKKNVIFLFFILFIANAYPQCVSIELSIEWEQGKNVFSDVNDTICIPYLNIIYRNNTDIPLYFFKVSESRLKLPQLPWGSLMYRNNRLYEKAINHLNYSNDKYKVEIGGYYPYYGQGWMVVNDTIISDEIEIDIINDDLADIYEYLFSFKNTAKKKDSTLYINFKVSDINENGILTKLKNQFVFLKAGNIYLDRYNLIGFKMVGGYFDFNIKADSLYDFVYTKPIWNEKQKTFVYKKAYLPEKVKEYKLYKGKFYKNSIGIKF